MIQFPVLLEGNLKYNMTKKFKPCGKCDGKKFNEICHDCLMWFQEGQKIVKNDKVNLWGLFEK